MANKYGWLLFFSIGMFVCIGQTNIKNNSQLKLDSIVEKFKKDSAHLYRFQKVRPYLAFDNRNSFIKNVPVNIRGIQLGVILFERNTVGIGFYGINSRTSKNVKTNIDAKEALTTLQLKYFTLFYQYAVIDKKYIELEVPLEIGIGSYSVKTISQLDNTLLQDKKGGLIPIGFGLNFILKPIKQLGISTMIGYRVVAEHNPTLNFNGFYYSLGLAIDVRQIVRDINFYGFKRPKYRKAIKNLY